MSALPRSPRVLAYGMGVDSTALLIELHARGEAPDLVLTADTGSCYRPRSTRSSPMHRASLSSSSKVLPKPASPDVRTSPTG
jgi:hypothetical protein